MPFLDGIVFTTLTLTTAGEVYSAKDEKLGKSFESIPEKENAVDEIKKIIKFRLFLSIKNIYLFFKKSIGNFY